MLKDGKPRGASWPVWKVILAVLFTSVIFVFLIWLFNSMLRDFKGMGYFHPLTMGEVLLGSGWLPLALWVRWAWSPRRKHAHWHRWLQTSGVFLYLTVLMLLLPVTYWHALLKNPWNWVVNGILVTLFVLAWILPVISYPMAKKLTDMQWKLNFLIYGLVGSGSILGASYGMYAKRNGEEGKAILVVALVSSFLPLFSAQMGSEYLWSRRPWAKEEGNEYLDGTGWDHRRLGRHVAVAQAASQVRRHKMGWFRKTAQDYVLEGTEQSLRKEYARAIKTLSKALDLNPQEATAYMHRGIAYLESGEVEKALQDFNQSLALEPNALAYYNRASAWLERKEYDLALRDLDEAIALAPQDKEIYLLRGIVYSERGIVYSEREDQERALQDVERAIALRHKGGKRAKAIVLERAGRDEEALACWDEALRGRRGDAIAIARHGLLLLRLGRREEARGDLRRAWRRRSELGEEWQVKVKQALDELKE